LTLAIKTIDFILFVIIKTFDWKVFFIASHLSNYGQILMNFLALNNFILVIPQEMTMNLRVSVEEIDKEHIILDKGAGDEGVREISDGDGVIVNAKHII
jgi:hypothetical protein